MILAIYFAIYLLSDLVIIMAMLWCIYELILVFIYFFIYQSFVLRIKSLLLCIKRNSFLTRKTCFMKNEHAFYHRKSNRLFPDSKN